jgi:hypothetical protein
MGDKHRQRREDLGRKVKPDGGEGDREAARRYNEGVEESVREHRDKPRPTDAPKSRREREDLASAEERGRSRARGEDPAVRKGEQRRDR